MRKLHNEYGFGDTLLYEILIIQPRRKIMS